MFSLNTFQIVIHNINVLFFIKLLITPFFCLCLCIFFVEAKALRKPFLVLVFPGRILPQPLANVGALAFASISLNFADDDEE